MRFLLAIILFTFDCYASTASLDISEVWARPSRNTPNSAAYMKIKNNTNKDINIIAAIAEIANRVEIHQTFEDRGVMRMHPIDKLLIPASEEVVLKPKAIHIMLINLKQQIKIDDKIKLSLITENGEKYDLEAIVKQSNAPCCGGKKSG